MTSWLRLWHDMPTDPKFRVIARKAGRPLTEVLSVFVLMMTNASASDARGELCGWDDEDAAAALDIDPEHVKAIRSAMQGKVLDGDNLSGWERRQPKREDDSAERVRAFRERQKQAETPCNADVTQSNAPEKSREEEIREEKITPLPPKRGPGPAEALKAFEAYNATALRCGLQQAARLTPDRQRKIIARLKDYGLEGWDAALANLERSKFLTGKNDRGWRANLDFILQASSFGKLHDGGYANGDPDTKPASKPSAVPYTYDEKAAQSLTEKLLADFMQGSVVQ